MKKTNKILVVILLLLVVGVVGLTIAYFSNSTDVSNVFTTQPYGTTVNEDFVAPSNWLPGDVTNKTITATNTGNVDEAVRISFTENWKTKNNGTLNGWIHSDGTKSTHSTAIELENDERVAIIHFVNPSEWTYEDGYYYYNYKLAPNETTSSLIESVEFNAKTKLDDTCDTTIDGNKKIITCNSSGEDYDDAKYTLTFTVETVQYNKYSEAWNLPQNTSIAILEEKPAPVVEVTGAEKLATTATNASDAEYNDSTKGNMFTFTHTVNGNTVNESRYIGDAPNNYVYFNCTDDEDTDSCEVWRIIGTFDVERTDPTDSSKTITETRMKIVRGSDFASTIAWDSSNVNDWSNASLKTYLNGTYYDSLSATAKGQIEDAIYYLGGWAWSNSDTTYTTEKIYEMERGTVTYNNSRPTSWEGKVALMYPSDMYMTYAKTAGVGCYNQPMSSSVCGSTNGAYSWIYNTNKLENGSSYQWTWLLSPNSSIADGVFNGYSSNLYDGNASSTGGGRPVVYLKSDIKIDTGTGEVGNPYVLK